MVKECGDCQHFGLCRKEDRELTAFGRFCSCFRFRPPYRFSEDEKEHARKVTREQIEAKYNH